MNIKKLKKAKEEAITFNVRVSYRPGSEFQDKFFRSALDGAMQGICNYYGQAHKKNWCEIDLSDMKDLNKEKE